MLHEGIYRGSMRHRRFSPKPHHFSYPLAFTLVNIDSLDRTLGMSRWWSEQAFNLISFYHQDYIGQGTTSQDTGGKHASIKSLRHGVSDVILENTGHYFDGEILLLTQPRFLGYAFNPVSFYLCYENNTATNNPDSASNNAMGRAKPAFIVADIENTPWGERFQYCLDARSHEPDKPLQFTFQKAFHVSPFMPMDLQYDWRFSLRNNHIAIHMRLIKDGATCFDATVNTNHSPFNASNMAKLPWQYPLQCSKVFIAIYWHALRLWLKRIPFYDHPSTSTHNTHRSS